jgi:hypothetical protein
VPPLTLSRQQWIFKPEEGMLRSQLYPDECLSAWGEYWCQWTADIATWDRSWLIPPLRLVGGAAVPHDVLRGEGDRRHLDTRRR